MLEFQLATVVLLILNMGLILILVARKTTTDLSPLERGLERVERGVHDEMSRIRTEADVSARSARDEISRVLKGITDSLNQSWPPPR